MPRSGFESNELTSCYGASAETDKFGDAAVATSEFNQVLLVSVYNMIYPITEKELHQVFDPYGCIENIIITSNTSYGLQALIQFQSFHCATQAKNHLHGRNIYDGCCQLDIQYFRSGYNVGSASLGHNDFSNCISGMLAIIEKMLTTVNNLQSRIEKMQFVHTQKCESFNNFFKSCRSSKDEMSYGTIDLKSIKQSTTKLSAIQNSDAQTNAISYVAQATKPYEKLKKADQTSSFMEVEMDVECKVFVEMIDKRSKPVEFDFNLHNSECGYLLVDETDVRFYDDVLILPKISKDDFDKKTINWIGNMGWVDQVLDEMHYRCLMAESLMLDYITNFFVFDPGGDTFDVDTWSAVVKTTTFENNNHEECEADMGIPPVNVGKLSLYTALGGLRPSACFLITIDVGTNNEKLLNDEFYIGLNQKRATGQEYAELLHGFVNAVKQNYGEKVLVQFEDFANHNAFELLAKYSTTHIVFNDDIQDTASIVLAGLVARLKVVRGKLNDHTSLFLGAGEAGTGIAELIAHEISKQTEVPVEVTRRKIWLVDSKGLIVRSRKESLQHFKKPWAHEHEDAKTLLEAVKSIKPTVLIGTSGVGQTFTKEVVEAMASFNEKPIILALSNPTSQSECTAEQAYTWTKGKAIFASGSPFDPVEYNGKTFVPGQSNNAYIFPGFGLGLIMSGAIRVHDELLLAASEALANEVTQEHYDKGLIYPPFTNIRKISAHIAANVAAKAYELGLATRLPRPANLVKYAESCMYTPMYRNYR